MNFCLLLSVLVVVSLKPWATAKDVFLDLGKRSVNEGAAEETKRRLGGDVGLPIINGLVQVASKARSWTQWLRRLLKVLKKWCHSHPPEVKLGKCFASYFHIKIPGIRRSEKLVYHNDESNATKHQKTPKSFNIKQKTTKGRNFIFKRIVLVCKKFVSSVADFLRQINKVILHHKDIFFDNDLAVCIWEYILKKFWMWVDSAPEVPSSSVRAFSNVDCHKGPHRKDRTCRRYSRDFSWW